MEKTNGLSARSPTKTDERQLHRLISWKAENDTLQRFTPMQKMPIGGKTSVYEIKSFIVDSKTVLKLALAIGNGASVGLKSATLTILKILKIIRFK